MRVRIRLEVVVGVVFAALLAAGPGIANGAAWLPPVPLNNAATSEPSVAVDAAGDTLATWNTPTARRSSRRRIGSPARPVSRSFLIWGTTRRPHCSPAGLDNVGAVVASNRHGDAIAAWVHQSDLMGDHTIEIASITPGRRGDIGRDRSDVRLGVQRRSGDQRQR